MVRGGWMRGAFPRLFSLSNQKDSKVDDCYFWNGGNGYGTFIGGGVSSNGNWSCLITSISC